jgi:RpiB/LacA/LacB family sugar-phosphate isomerase
MKTKPKGAQRVYIGSDHGGFELKNELKEFLANKDYVVEDIGAHRYNSKDDYPDFAFNLCKKVIKSGGRGILLCKSGAGMYIAANKVLGIYAAAAWNEESAMRAKKDENANVLCIAALLTNVRTAKRIVNIWLEYPFEGGRHLRRLNKIKRIEKRYLS